MNTATTDTDAEPTGAATYSPEDNKLRLYIGRVPRDEYEKLRAEGWKALYKQREAGGGDFVATWTPERRDTALKYSGGFIADEDMGPAERAADRAERFSGYRDKREGEAVGHADRFDAGPQAHGYQSEARAERAAKRHDRIADRAGDQWGKAEYWQRRTSGVISHALHLSSPGVRMGRIKTIEAELRGVEKTRAEWAEKWRAWQKVAAMTDAAEQTKRAEILSGYGYSSHEYTHPHNGRKGSLWSFLREDAADRITGAEACTLYFPAHHNPDAPEWEQGRLADWVNHYKLRLAYENQMIEAAGGRAAFVEMEVGGWIGERQIRKVNKSNATGRVVSVTLKCKGSRYDSSAAGFCLIPYNIERLPSDAYRAPTAEDLAALDAEKKSEKATAPKKAPCPLINPTDADAERLQELLNAHHPAYVGDSSPRTVSRCTQAAYSANSGGSYSRCETVEITGGGFLISNNYMSKGSRFPSVVKVRMHGRRVMVLTDKPQKPFPAALWNDPRPAVRAQCIKQKAELLAAVRSGSSYDWTEKQKELIRAADSVGLVDWRSMSQYALTEEGARVLLETVKA